MPILMLFTPETVVQECSELARVQVAMLLKIPLDWVELSWVKEGEAMRPKLELGDPAWKDSSLTPEQRAQLPSLVDVLRQRGVQEDPRPQMDVIMARCVQDLGVKLGAFV